MRILVVYNPSAGPDEVNLEALLEALARGGHETLTQSKSSMEIGRDMRFAPEVVIAAGGDGTVTAVARLVTGSGIPILPVPLGTANNIATYLGTGLDPLRALAAGRVLPFDAGICGVENDERFFFEGAGVGPFPELIDLDPVETDLPREEQLRRASHVLADVAADAPTYSCRLDIDGMTLEGAFLMVEVMNIGRLGPGLLLAGGADPTDGLLDVVVVPESDRRALIEYLEARVARPDMPSPFTARRACRTRLTTAGPAPLHIDDRAFNCDSPIDVTFSVRPRAVSFLIDQPPADGG